MRSPVAPAAALLLAALALFLVYDHTRDDSLSADEPIHILSGYFAVASRSAIVNIEHPPLMKILAGLGLATLPLPPPPAPRSCSCTRRSFCSSLSRRAGATETFPPSSRRRSSRAVCGLCPGHQAASDWAVAMNRLTPTGSK